MKVLRSVILLTFLSLEIVSVISDEKNVPSNQDSTIYLIGSLNDGFYNKKDIKKVSESEELPDGIYYKPKDESASLQYEVIMKKHFIKFVLITRNF